MARYQITHSTELMQNYLQATVLAPDRQFQAVQGGRDGVALLFSIGESLHGDSFNVTVETIGERHGWTTESLSDETVAKDCPGGGCQQFAVAERSDGSVHMAMVLRQAHDGLLTDRLYLADFSLSSSGRANAPTWTAFPYDDPKNPRPTFQIGGISLSEATDKGYIVADVIRDPSSPTKEIARYYIDQTKRSGQAWNLHDVPVDIEAGTSTTALGRRDGAHVDGLYVSGQIDGAPQIIYTPLFNETRPDRPPLSSDLKLTAEGDVVAEAIAACRNPDNTSDLFAAAKGVLYRFASTNQTRGATAVVATTSSHLQGVRDLYAFPYADSVMVWGRNLDNEIFYTTCSRTRLDTPAAWSIPVPIMTGVDRVSPYVNRANSANTIFAHTGANELRMGVKSPGTGVWTWRNVTLPPADLKAPARRFNSYTTQIQVTDERHQPADGVTVALSATSVTSVYINHLYYIVGPTPIRVRTDAVGSVTIVEAVPRFTGTQFKVSVVDDPSSELPINPMGQTFAKATALQSVQSLRSATITTYVKGPDGQPKATTRPLVAASVDDAALQAVVHLNKQLAYMYPDAKKPPLEALLQTADSGGGHAFPIPPDALKVDAGDLFQFLETRSPLVTAGAAADQAGPLLGAEESGWEAFIRWIEGAWEFVVKVGEAVYRAVLRVIEDVVSAVRWVFEKIVAAVEDLIEFLQYLFEWDDFKRTKDVLKNVLRVFLDHQVDQIPVVRKEFDDSIESVIKVINQWSGISDFSGLGEAGTGQISHQAKPDSPNAPGGLLVHHFQGNIGIATQEAMSSPDAPSSVLEALEAAMSGEAATLGEAFGQLKQLMRDAPEMSVVDILKRLTGILADALLRSARVVIDALLDLLVVVARKALDLFDAPIHIPVISDILNDIGVPDFSMLDVICWVAAVPVTIGYKLAEAISGNGHKAPFPDNDVTTFLIEAKDFGSLAAAFRAATHPLDTSAGLTASAAAGPIPMSDSDERIVSIVLHSVSGVCGVVSAFVDASESLIPNALVPMPLTAACVTSAIVGGVSRGAANALVPRCPLEGEVVGALSKCATLSFLLNKAFWGYLSWRPVDTKDYRAYGAGIDATVILLPSLVITCLHFSQLAEKPAGKERTIAILDETSYMSTYVARVLYALVVTGVFDADEEVKIGVAAAMGVAEVVHGSLQAAEAAVEGLG